MANCTTCGKKMGILDMGFGGVCSTCYVAANKPAAVEAAKQAHSAHLEEQNAPIHAILLTTESAPNLKINRRIEIVTAECAFGMNIFKDLFAGVRDIVGGRSEAVQKTMRDARKVALFELKREAYLVGANAIVGVDLDYTEISANSNMIMLVASGTAVVIDQ
jgi:uncharacterized protein YbjQ (UPF0145 family)